MKKFTKYERCKLQTNSSIDKGSLFFLLKKMQTFYLN